ncbi:hypothetical protein K1719_041738 [Acacia pycnantha]|nr:hypothetical protein K1719_041738 [Acacia pycnantha]
MVTHLSDVKLQKEQDLQHFHVLVVDNNLIDRKLLEKLLQVSSCKVTSVDSGDKALKYLGLLDDLDNASPTSSESSPSSPQSPQQEVLVGTCVCESKMVSLRKLWRKMKKEKKMLLQYDIDSYSKNFDDGYSTTQIMLLDRPRSFCHY